MIVPPKTNFTVLFDKKATNSLIIPGLYLEVLVSFQTDVLDNFLDKVEFITEGYKCELELKAFKPQPIVYFEPIINFGCVLENCKKTETIEFVNEGLQNITLEFRLEKKTELQISSETMELHQKPLTEKEKDIYKNKSVLHVTYEYYFYLLIIYEAQKIIKRNLY